MNYKTLMELIKERRSIRVYKPDPVPDEYVEKIIEAGRWAPTGANTQPFEFVVVKETETKKKISKIFSEAAEQEEINLPSQPQTSIETAPLLIIVLGDTRFKKAYLKEVDKDEIIQASLDACVQNMHLAATALGLGGSVWKRVEPLEAIKIRRLLDIPSVFIVKTILPLGYPQVKPEAPPRREVLVHREKYDRSKFKSEKEINEIIATTVVLEE